MINDSSANYRDVVILGGGLAGLSLGIQLKQRLPELGIAIIERNSHPVASAAHKVGESTVELSSHYFADVLGLKTIGHGLNSAESKLTAALAAFYNNCVRY